MPFGAPIAAVDSRSWAVFLSRAAALKALTTLALVVAFAVIASGAGSAPLEQAELNGASRNPAAYRIFAAIDVSCGSASAQSSWGSGPSARAWRPCARRAWRRSRSLKSSECWEATSG